MVSERSSSISLRSPPSGGEALDAHRRVRRGSEGGRRSYTVEPQLPVDVLGVYVLLPVVDT